MYDVDLYINKSKSFIDFMLMQKQWSGLTRRNVDEWLRNFRNQPEEKQALVYRLLTSLIYFSEEDINDAMRAGVYRCLSYQVLLEEQKVNDFSLSSHRITKLHDDIVSQACFVPLLDSGSPHESGNYMSRVLVQQGIISASQSVFINRVPNLLKSGKYKHLVIVDDCVGSGDQLLTFWQTTRIEDGESILSIADLCKKYSVSVNYLTLFGYADSIDHVRAACVGLNICCVRELKDEHRVFSDSSYVWNDQMQRDEALTFFEEVAKNVGIQIKGYKDFDFAFVMHNTIPDWSLPIFWKETADWKALLRRKNTDE